MKRKWKIKRKQKNNNRFFRLLFCIFDIFIKREFLIEYLMNVYGKFIRI